MAEKFLEVLNSPDVRENKAMELGYYRNNQTLPSIIATFSYNTREEIFERMRSGHHLDTGSCTDSCDFMDNEGF